MHFAAHALAEPGVDQLVALQRPLALELRGDDDRLEVRVVVGQDAHLRAGQAGQDQVGDFICGHGGSAAAGRGRVRPASLKEKRRRL